LILSSSKQSDKGLAALFSVGASLSAGLLGGNVRQKWHAKAEKEVLVARGKSAIRNLRLLLNSVRALEARVIKYMESLPQIGQKEEVVKICLEEIVEKCETIHEEGVNAIEHWTDIIPEADVTTQIEKIRELKGELERQTLEAQRLDAEVKQFRASKEKSGQEISELNRRYENVVAELQRKKRDLAALETTLHGTLSVGAAEIYSQIPSYPLQQSVAFEVPKLAVKPSATIRLPWVRVDESAKCKLCAGPLEAGVCTKCGKLDEPAD
jgi:DNA repair exonuclease SbcCD ATPase subunit